MKHDDPTRFHGRSRPLSDLRLVTEPVNQIGASGGEPIAPACLSEMGPLELPVGKIDCHPS